MSAPQCLRRFTIPRTHPIPYAHAQTIQEKIVSEFLSYKAIISSRDPPKKLPPAPLPAIFAFTPEPVYTTGRREVGALTTTQIHQLKEPLVSLGKKNVARIYETKRGGQITFHGPGQAVIYPILDIKSIRSERFPNGMTARQYVEVLELTTMDALMQFNITSFRTDDPGVWVTAKQKIAAVGVHLRRNISSFGVAVNLDTDLRWFDRIVACGLEGKKMTSMVEQVQNIKTKKFSKIWTQMFALQLWNHSDGRLVYDKEETMLDELSLADGIDSDHKSTRNNARRLHSFTFQERLNLLREVADVDTTNLKRKPTSVKLSDNSYPDDLFTSLLNEEPTEFDSGVADNILATQLFQTPDLRNPNAPKERVRWKEVHDVEPAGTEESYSTATGYSPVAKSTNGVDIHAEQAHPVFPMSSKPRQDNSTA